MDRTSFPRVWLGRLAFLLGTCLWLAATAMAQEADPPARVAALTHQQGSVVFAPDGEQEWVELPLNRPLTRGDRVWTDKDGRAELQLGTATLHLDGEAHIAFFELDERAAQVSLTQGSLGARVRELAQGENFEIDTPNLALRALQPADLRVDVDHERGTTRVLVRSGQVVVYGERGESLRLVGGQQAVFEGRGLEQLRVRSLSLDDFDQWTLERNRREDHSLAARFLPRQVVGAAQLDAYGSWTQDATHGTVWYPRVVHTNWAPYRYGRWTYIRPWGWTWVDEAPWGFAPFHYGRWAVIGTRWAWVPGPLGPRPVYAPALVAFVGGSGASVSLQLGSSPGIAWYPLAPGEAWMPAYRVSSTYLSRANPQVLRHGSVMHLHRTRAEALTALRVEDFHRGRPVRDHWKAVRPQEAAQAPLIQLLPAPQVQRVEPLTQPGQWRARPDHRPRVEAERSVVAGNEVRRITGPSPADEARAQRERARAEAERQRRQPDFVRQHEEQGRRIWMQQQQIQENSVNEQRRAQREQWRLQREAERQHWRDVREDQRGR
jgi:hypothetical protein